MSKDTGSTVTVRVEFTGFGVDSLGLVVISSIGFGTGCTGTVNAKCRLSGEFLLGDLHVDVVQDIGAGHVYTRLSLTPGVDVFGSEVNIRASERKIFIGRLSIIDLHNFVGVGVPTDGLDETSLCRICGSGVHLELRVKGRIKSDEFIEERNDLVVVDDSISSLVVVISIVTTGFVAIIFNELRPPSSNKFFEVTLSNKSTQSEVLDHVGHGVHEQIEAILGKS